MNAKQFKNDIDAHATSAAEHYMTVMTVKEDGAKTLEAAKLAGNDVDKIKMHLEAAE
jgi:hypothetical protein